MVLEEWLHEDIRRNSVDNGFIVVCQLHDCTLDQLKMYMKKHHIPAPECWKRKPYKPYKRKSRIDMVQTYFFKDGLSYKQCAEKLGIDIKTVKYYIAKIREQKKEM